MRLGPFFFDTKEIFLLLAAILIGFAFYFGWPLWLFDPESLLVLTIIMLITKGLLPAIHNESYFVLGVISVFLLLYFSLFQVLLFYCLSFILFKIFRVF